MDSTAKIKAIKAIREKTEMGLRAAKLAIEAHIAEHPRATFGEIVDAVVNANPSGPAAPTYADLRAENARLRAALERLLGELPQPNLDDPDLDDAIDAAADVLGKDQPNANT